MKMGAGVSQQQLTPHETVYRDFTRQALLHMHGQDFRQQLPDLFDDRVQVRSGGWHDCFWSIDAVMLLRDLKKLDETPDSARLITEIILSK